MRVVAGCWLMVTGTGFQLAGYWRLVTGSCCWILAAGYKVRPKESRTFSFLYFFLIQALKHSCIHTYMYSRILILRSSDFGLQTSSSPKYLIYKSGRSFLVRSTACSCFQSSTNLSFPLNRISGTFIPLYSAGRV